MAHFGYAEPRASTFAENKAETAGSCCLLARHSLDGMFYAFSKWRARIMRRTVIKHARDVVDNLQHNHGPPWWNGLTSRPQRHFRRVIRHAWWPLMCWTLAPGPSHTRSLGVYTLLTRARLVAENSARDLKEKLAWWLPAVWSLSSMVAFDVLPERAHFMDGSYGPTSCHVTMFASGWMVRLACGRAVTEMCACCRRISASPTAGMNSSPCGCSSSTHPGRLKHKSWVWTQCFRGRRLACWKRHG